MNDLRRWIERLVLCATCVMPLACKPDKDDDDHAKAPSTQSASAEKEVTSVTLTAEAIAKFGIKVEEANKRELPEVADVSGRVAFNSDAIARIGSPVKGRVVSVGVQLGDTVEKDADLFVVESAELAEAQSDYLQKVGAKNAAEKQVGPLKEAYERAKQLMEKSEGITLTEVQKRLADYQAVQSAFDAAQLGLTAADNKLRLFSLDAKAIEHLARSGEINPRFHVKAPIAGQVIERDVTIGALVSPDKDLNFTIADTSSVFVISDVPEGKLADVHKDAEARIKIAALGEDEEAIIGKVSFIAPTLDPATRTAEVRCVLKNKENELKPGMFAQVSITLAGDEKPQPVIAIPDEGVLTVEDHTIVFVPGPAAGVFVKKEVKVGRTVGDWVEITSGLKAGAKVVTTGASILKAELTKPAKEDE